MIGRVAASLALLAGPAWALTDPPQATDAGRQVVRESAEGRQVNRERSQEQAQPSQAAQEERTLSQKPNLTDDVRLRVETYTGNDYSK